MNKTYIENISIVIVIMVNTYFSSGLGLKGLIAYWALLLIAGVVISAVEVYVNNKKLRLQE